MNDHAPGPEGQTRQRIMSLLLHHGTMSASELSKELKLSAAGIRRHVDNLVSDGLGKRPQQQVERLADVAAQPAFSG